MRKLIKLLPFNGCNYEKSSQTTSTEHSIYQNSLSESTIDTNDQDDKMDNITAENPESMDYLKEKHIVDDSGDNVNVDQENLEANKTFSLFGIKYLTILTEDGQVFSYYDGQTERIADTFCEYFNQILSSK